VELLGDDSAGAVTSTAAIACLDPPPPPKLAATSSSSSSEAVIASCLQGSSRIDISGKYLQAMLDAKIPLPPLVHAEVQQGAKHYVATSAPAPNVARDMLAGVSLFSTDEGGGSEARAQQQQVAAAAEAAAAARVAAEEEAAQVAAAAAAAAATAAAAAAEAEAAAEAAAAAAAEHVQLVSLMNDVIDAVESAPLPPRTSLLACVDCLRVRWHEASCVTRVMCDM